MYRSTSFIVGVIVIILIAGTIAAFNFYKNQVRTLDLEPPTTSPQVGFPQAQTLAPEVSDSNKTPNIQPETGEGFAQVKNLGITLDTPEESAQISSPVKISGFANVLDGQVELTVRDASNNILGEGLATACFGLNACPFVASIPYTHPKTPSGTITASAVSPEESFAQYQVIIPVDFK